jgi:3-dehydroquinate synthase
MIGAFYQPDAVFAGIGLLKSLSPRDYASGLAEIIKTALLDGGWLETLNDEAELLRERSEEALEAAVARAAAYKAGIVSRDEREGGLRMLLNLGHTYGHAVEAAGAFSRYTHGEAVAIGLNGALLLSEAVAGLDKNVTSAVVSLLKKFSLPVTAAGIDKNLVWELLRMDKKTIGGDLRWVLLSAPGNPLVSREAPPDLVKKILEKITV